MHEVFRCEIRHYIFLSMKFMHVCVLSMRFLINTNIYGCAICFVNENKINKF